MGRTASEERRLVFYRKPSCVVPHPHHQAFVLITSSCPVPSQYSQNCPLLSACVSFFRTLSIVFLLSACVCFLSTLSIVFLLSACVSFLSTLSIVFLLSACVSFLSTLSIVFLLSACVSFLSSFFSRAWSCSVFLSASSG